MELPLPLLTGREGISGVFTTEKKPGGARRWSTIMLLGAASAVLLLAGAIVSGATCQAVGSLVSQSRKKTCRFVFPEGAQGRYILRCQVPGASPLPTEEGFRVVRFAPGVRVIETSEAYVWGHERFVEEHFVEQGSARRAVEISRGSCDPYPWNGLPPHEVVCDLR